MKKGALLVGYARVSKADDQDTATQVKALRQAGCKQIFEEKEETGSSAAPSRHKGRPLAYKITRILPEEDYFRRW
jgi:DNA invertase Pin-like site-specific DNA recombinase